MSDAHKRRFEVIAVWKFDRFARSVSHLLRALDTFRVLESSLLACRNRSIRQLRQAAWSLPSLERLPNWNAA
jgi:hypothetical protein